MFIKPIDKPLRLLKLEALARRLPHNHPKHQEILQKLYRAEAGYSGEKSLHYYLTQKAGRQYRILHSVKLNTLGHDFQMDFLLLHQTHLLILEVKNIAGTLRFEPDRHQVIWTKPDNSVKVLPDFYLQAIIQKEHLANWISEADLPQIPINPLVVISNPNCRLEIPPQFNNHPSIRNMIRSAYLPTRLSSELNQHSKATFSLSKLESLILEHNLPDDQCILKETGVKPGELTTGVLCPACLNKRMIKHRYRWLCSHCGKKSRNAHVDTLIDFSLLVGPLITNIEFRWFAQIESASTAKHLLRELKLPVAGHNRGRFYSLTHITGNLQVNPPNSLS
ncbi:nuclease-related domain-containing protein [Alteribacter natronophilus]|uniref:nuclease-related domain-containing protein n=1 Tax=Alteribacter natronophilus TaxID=2583810 RepID=UPI00110F0A3D|nr:nuclease-related domain-containing protein [Alteribacter natronophilus]TMW72171.1 NERD domain-containing protein [Alteribacter natronophilus]